MTRYPTGLDNNLSFTIVRLILLMVVVTTYCFRNNAWSADHGSVVINNHDQKPSVDERIKDWTAGIKLVKEARSSIQKYVCGPKQKCKLADYDQVWQSLSQLFYLRLRPGRDRQFTNCLDLYGEPTKSHPLLARRRRDEYCMRYCTDLHSAARIVQDLRTSIERNNKGSRHISSEESRLILEYLGKLTKYQRSMEKVLTCLKKASVTDKTRCDSLGLPLYEGLGDRGNR